MKTIASFKLHKKGEEGIEISSEQLSKSLKQEAENIDKVYEDKVNTYRKNSVPAPIMDAISRLKYYFLNLTGHWISLYEPYFDKVTMKIKPLPNEPKKGHVYLQTLWQSTDVTQGKFTENSLQIMGVLDIVDSKPLSINPPVVTAEDNLEWYEDAKDQVRVIFDLLVNYFSTAPLQDIEDYRRYLLDRANEGQKQSIAAFTDEQIMNTVMDGLSKRGAFKNRL